MYIIKKEVFFSYNDFSILADDFEYNDNIDFNYMVNKFLNIAKKINNEIHTKNSNDLEDSAFYYLI